MAKHPCLIFGRDAGEVLCAFLSKVDLSQFTDPFCMEEILDYVEHVAPGNPSAKAAIDIALHDLVGKLLDSHGTEYGAYHHKKRPIHRLQ